MSEVNRYTVSKGELLDFDTLQAASVDCLVDYDDYAALEAECERLRQWKAEEIQVMSPVFDYARSIGECKPGHSLTQWLIDDHIRLRAELESIKGQEPVAYRALFMVEDGAWSDQGRPWVTGTPDADTLAYFGDPVRADRWKIEYAFRGGNAKPTA